MSCFTATVDRVRGDASASPFHRPGPGRGGAAWPPRPAGKRFRDANRPWFSPGFALVSVSFRPAFPLLFRHNPLKYNETAIFRRRRGPRCAHDPARPPTGMARNPRQTSCNRKLCCVTPKNQPVTTALPAPPSRPPSSFPQKRESMAGKNGSLAYPPRADGPPRAAVAAPLVIPAKAGIHSWIRETNFSLDISDRLC